MTPAVSPAFSVIVPVYRHWDLVPGLFEALAAQEFRDFEILLVDNAPGEPRPVLDLPGAARILPCAAPGSYAARNLGGGGGAGAGPRLHRRRLPARSGLADGLAAAFASEDAERLLAGPVRMTTQGAVPNRWEAYDLIRGIPQARYVGLGYAATANLAVPRSVFERAGRVRRGPDVGGRRGLLPAGRGGGGADQAGRGRGGRPSGAGRVGGVGPQGPAGEGRPDPRGAAPPSG